MQKSANHLKVLHLHKIIPPLPPSFPKQVQEEHKPGFFNPVTPSRITTSDISKSSQVRFLIV